MHMPGGCPLGSKGPIMLAERQTRACASCGTSSRASGAHHCLNDTAFLLCRLIWTPTTPLRTSACRRRCRKSPRRLGRRSRPLSGMWLAPATSSEHSLITMMQTGTLRPCLHQLSAAPAHRHRSCLLPGSRQHMPSRSDSAGRRCHDMVECCDRCGGIEVLTGQA